jgi:hypothetical protein
MFETIATFFAGFAAAYILTWPTLIGLVLVGTVFEYNGARGWAVFIGLVASATAYFFFDVPFVDVLIYALIYLAIGFVWSFWRYRRFVTTEADNIRSSSFSPDMKRRSAENLRPSNHLDTITAWIFIWPFSFLESVAGDLIDIIQTLVKKVFRGVYHTLYTRAVRDLVAPPNDSQ